MRSLFSYDSHGKQLIPFLLLDYAGPANFTPTDTPRGVGQPPHRGFETVTIVGYGPFVMNTEQEIRQAIEDFKRGGFGAIRK